MIEMTREEMYEEFQVYCRNQLDSCDGCIFVRDKRCGNKNRACAKEKGEIARACDT